MDNARTPDEARPPGDADRERAATALMAAVGEGRLTLDEVDARLRAAYAAPTLRDLAGVTADLPAPAQASLRSPARPAVPRLSSDAWPRLLGGAVLMIGIWLAASLAAGHALFFWPAIAIGC